MGWMKRIMSSGILLPVMAACGGPDEDMLTRARLRMVAEQLVVPERGIGDPEVLRAMRTVPRHAFVPAELRGQAYGDHPLPIGHEQTISQPFIVAFMTEQLAVRPGLKVLEIGTGSGYQAAVLAELGARVFSIEIIPPLAGSARRALDASGFFGVHIRTGDGHKGWPEEAPFDRILVTCSPDKVPHDLIDQLREGGRMVIPVTDAGGQSLYLLEKEGGVVRRRAILPVRFVPMTGGG